MADFIDELCQKRAASAASPRTTTGAGEPKVAEFEQNSATFVVRRTNGCSLSRNNILCNRFFHEVIEIIDETAAQNRLEGHAGLK